jgi:hypothetical protein
LLDYADIYNKNPDNNGAISCNLNGSFWELPFETKGFQRMLKFFAGFVSYVIIQLLLSRPIENEMPRMRLTSQSEWDSEWVSDSPGIGVFTPWVSFPVLPYG